MTVLENRIESKVPRVVGRGAGIEGPRAFWLSPVFIALFVGACAITPVFFIGDQEYRLLWRTPKSVDASTLVLFVCGVLAIAFGALIADSRRLRAAPLASAWPGFDERTRDTLRRTSTWLTTLALIGYAGFVVVIVRSGVGLGELFSGSSEVKDRIGTLPGVTTLTQFGIAAVVVSGLLLAQRYSRAELVKMSIIVILAVVRTYINTERLATMELVVPLLVIFAAKLAATPGTRRRIARLIPIVFGLLVITLFGTFEYFRSWTYYRNHTSGGFIEFVFSRFAGYYATAMNNGYLNLHHVDWPGRLPYDTLAGFWTAPVVENLHLYELLGGTPPPITRAVTGSRYEDVLLQYGNPEFNSESGYSGPFLDYGHIGGLVYFLLAGLILGLLYRAFRQGSPAGLFLYPVAFIGLLELPRYIYWSYGRAIYAWIALAVVILIVLRCRRRQDIVASAKRYENDVVSVGGKGDAHVT